MFVYFQISGKTIWLLCVCVCVCVRAYDIRLSGRKALCVCMPVFEKNTKEIHHQQAWLHDVSQHLAGRRDLLGVDHQGTLEIRPDIHIFEPP